MCELLNYFFCCLCLFVAFTQSIAQNCRDGETSVIINITPDAWTSLETAWEVVDEAGNLLIVGSSESDTICVADTACLTFTIYDGAGDGIFLGNYSVFHADTLVLTGSNFGSIATVQFGSCKAGQSCFFPAPATLATANTIFPNTDFWYEFTPNVNGQFVVTTCPLTCSKFWIYDHCENLIWTDNQEGAIAYQADTCSLVTNLVADSTYYIRVATDMACVVDSLTWSITYQGPIVGCQDNNACNYNPLATISDPESCLYPPDSDCPPKADLIVVEEVLKNSLRIDSIYNQDPCFIAENCLSGNGARKIIRFTTEIKNIGGRDFYLGSPPPTPEEADEQWEWDACHNHWHYEGYAEYLLYNDAQEKIPIGFKNGFCVMDIDCPNLGLSKFNCANQGLSAGCSDIYEAGLDCQWIDITNVPDGQYTLVVRVNWQKEPDALQQYESNYFNNWTQVCIELNKTTGPILTILEDCPAYTDCFGEVYGEAVYDCTGLCGGTALIGDVNLNKTYDDTDILTYVDLVLTQRTDLINECTDINGDGQFTLLDIVQLTKCKLAEEELHIDSLPNLLHTHCNLPANSIVNERDTTFFEITTINKNQQYIDISIKHVRHHLLAYQIKIEGITIQSIENRSEQYDADIFTDNQETILVTSLVGDYIDRQTSFQPALRIYYLDPLLKDSICLQAQQSITVNYESAINQVEQNCIVLKPDINLYTLSNFKEKITIQPNPFTEQTVIKFENVTKEQYKLQLFDYTGKPVTKIYHTHTATFTIEAGGLEKGLYFFRLTSKTKAFVGKLIIQ